MSINYWSRQESNKSLFPELEWSKPENKLHAGKLLVIGGNLQGFSAVATAFTVAEKAGIGMTRLIMPDAIQKSVKAFMPEADFAPSTPSGSFATNSLDIFLENAGWADAVLVAGDLGRNSETAIALETFVSKYDGPLCLTKDAVDYFTESPAGILNREVTVIVASLAQAQKLLMNAKFKTPVTYDMDLMHLVAALHEFTCTHQAHLIVKHHDVIVVAAGGQVSSTKLAADKDMWRVETAAAATVWWLQHPTKTFEALTTAIVAK